jgi:predicted transcriptional regulator
MSKAKVTKEALIELYVNDPTATYESVAKKLGSSRAAVAKAMKRHGVESRNTAGKPRVEIPELSDKAWLEQKFIQEKMSATGIGKLLNCSQTTVLNSLKKYDIDTQRPENPLLYDKEWLEEQYITKQRTYEDIGNEIGVTKYGVYHAMQRFDIKARNHTSAYSQLNDKEWLQQKYVDEKMSITDIANLVGCKPGAIHSSLTHMGIKTRNHKEGWHTKFPEGRQGKNTPNWKGGISIISEAVRSCTKYSEWRMAVFKRDYFACVQCGSKENIEADHKKAFAKIMRENNIRSMEDALACAELWDINNGQTLCHEHHLDTETHSQRLKPIDLDNDTRSEVEKKIDKLEKSKGYYQKRNWQLQNKIVPKLRNEIKQLREALGDTYVGIKPLETKYVKKHMEDAELEEMYDKRLALYEGILADNNIAIPPIED